MNPAPDFIKPCYRCDAPVRMSAAEYRADEFNLNTCCAVCRDKLAIEAGFVGSPAQSFPSLESANHTPPAAPAQP